MINKLLTFDDLKTMKDSEKSLIFCDYELLKIMLKKNISEHRYLHSLSVADTALKLAKAHNIDENKAYLAGLLHDVCKYKSEDGINILIKYLNKYEPNRLNGITGVYHSWVAYYFLKECGLKDEEVLRAIYNHTILEEYNPLNVIIYIADKREPLREINDDILSIAMKDIDLAYSMLKLDVNRYLKENGKSVDKILIELKELLDSKQGENITILDFRNNSPFVDYFIIASARNERLGNAIINYIEDYAIKNNIQIKSKNNSKDGKWLLIDLSFIVVHIFVDEERNKYNLEGLWKDLIIKI